MWIWIEKVFCLDYLYHMANGVPSGIQDWLNELESEKGYTVQNVQFASLGEERGERYILAIAKCRKLAQLRTQQLD